MTMYVDLLRFALEGWPAGTDGDALVRLARRQRETLLEHPPSGHHLERLTLELAYDRTLIRVCEAHGVDTCPDRFVMPFSERMRLEAALRDLGIDLEARRRRRAPPP